MSFDLLKHDARTNAWEHRRRVRHRTEKLNRSALMREAERVGVGNFVRAEMVRQWPCSKALFS